MPEKLLALSSKPTKPIMDSVVTSAQHLFKDSEIGYQLIETIEQ